MGALLTAPALFDGVRVPGEDRLPASSADGAAGGGERTLEDLIVTACSELAANARAECPVCAGELIRRAPGLAVCESCAAQLS